MPVSLPFLTALFAVLDLLCWWFLDRMFRAGKPSPARRNWRLGISAFFLLQLYCLVVVPGSILSHFQPPALLHVGRTPGCLFFLWHFLILPVVAAVLAVVTAVDVFRRLYHPEDEDPKAAADPKAVSRRRFLALAGPGAAAALTGASLFQLSRFRVREMMVEISGLPPALDGLRIAHVSDLHVGRLTHGDILDDLVYQTNALKPDLVLVTGDLIDQYLSDLPTALDTISQLQSKYGTFVIEGNHDLFEGVGRFRDNCLRSPGEAQFLFLDTKTITIQGQPVQILGMPWCGSSDTEIASVVSHMATLREPDAFPILLAHHPHAFDSATGAGFPLILSGHTHGGQLMLTDSIGWGPVMFRYWSGLYRKGRSRLVVSNGVGNWFPLRIGAEAEVIHLTLKAVAG